MSRSFEDHVIGLRCARATRTTTLHNAGSARREERGEPAPVGGRVSTLFFLGNDALYNRAEDASTYARIRT